jgi:3-oxoacyl-[acyl-carrier-protein] synthase III
VDIPGVYLADFRFTTGEFVPLDDLADADVRENLDVLRQAGMTGAAVASEQSVVMAAKVLADSGLPANLSGVVYATDDFDGGWPPDVLSTLLSSAGRPNTPGFILSGNGCANLGFAVRSAAGLCGKAAPVALVTADRVRPGQRVLTGSVSLLGDGAAVCTVTTEPEGPAFELVACRSAIRAAPPGARAGTATLRATLDGVREVTGTTLAAAGWKPGDIAGMLVGEYSPTALRLLAAASGVKAQFDWARVRAGHCYSADLIRGMDALTRDSGLSTGDRLLALASGPSSWTMLALRYTAGTAS